MSNIIFKGNAIKNFGEYLPNIYIDRVVVRNNGPDAVFYDISYSLFFHVTDEFNQEDISKIVERVSFYFAVSTEEDRNAQLLTKQQIINDLRRPDIATNPVGDSTRTSFYPFGKEPVLQNLSSGVFRDDVYDSQERKVLIVSAEETISYSTLGKDDSHIYLYAFTSLYNLEQFGQLVRDVSNSNAIFSLSISSVAYEKVFSPNLNILTQEQVVYFDLQSAKYSETPILALDRNFYKTENMKREQIINKTRTLVSRFDSPSNPDVLNQTIQSIRYVLQTEAESVNLLVELDKVRKSFPNKTNNNRLGNLYTAFSRLLININSAFLPSELVTKERVLTGKVIDRRGEVRTNIELGTLTDMEDYIPSDGFFIERLRISEDETNDLSSNGGFFHIRYEALVKNSSKISQLLNIDKLLEFPLPSLQDEMRRILFSLYKIRKVNLIKTDAVTETKLVSLGITYDRENRSEERTITLLLPGEARDGDKETYLKENLLDLKGPTPETIISYEFYDLDRYPSFYEISENERGGMKFKYDVSAIFTDNTMLIASVIEKMFTKEIVNLLNYFDFASEICSYNNIQNRFNDFFSAEITNFYEEREQPFPWETSVLAFCLVQYVLTDRFATIAELSNYSKNLISSINPYSGTLSSIQRLLLEMEEFQDQVFGSGSVYFNKKRELLSSTNEIEITKEFNISVKTQNPDRLDREASEEIEYFLNLFDDSSFIYFGNRSDPNNLPDLDSRNGGEYDYRDDVTYTTVSTSISDYYRTFVTENILPILENINMRFLDVNRVSGTRGLSYNVQSSLLRTDGTIEGESLYNLTEILQLGDKSSDDRDLLKFLRSSDKQKMQDELEQFFANWMAQMFYTLKKERDDFLLRGGLGNIMPVTDGGGGSSSVRGSIASGDPVFYLKFVTNLQNDLLDAIREAFYEAVASYENSSGSQIDDVQGGDRTSVKSFIYDISIGSRADNAIDQIAKAATYYFRETTNQQKLFPDFQRSATLVSVGNAFARSILRTTGELYDSIKDPITQLPDFITDEDPYIRYTGPELDRIPNIEVSPDDVTES